MPRPPGSFFRLRQSAKGAVIESESAWPMLLPIFVA
jgi:hypothetical protein